MEKDTKAYWDESAEDFQRRVAGHGWNLEFYRIVRPAFQNLAGKFPARLPELHQERVGLFGQGLHGQQGVCLLLPRFFVVIT